MSKFVYTVRENIRELKNDSIGRREANGFFER